MRVTKEGIERIKAANELATVVRERGIAVRRKGKSLVASCPFHKEKTPSFTITPSKGLFHCFGCGVSGDVIGFVTRYDKVPFTQALNALAKRAGLSLTEMMKEPGQAFRRKAGRSASGASRSELLSRVVEHYHKTFCEREEPREYLHSLGLTDSQVALDFKLGYADGSLLDLIPKEGELREELVSLGVITGQGGELLDGCIVVPIPDPRTGEWTSLYGRATSLKGQGHCYLPGPLRGVVNFQAARVSSEVILTESILGALSFYQAGIRTAIPLYGTNGFIEEHLDLLKRENVNRVVLALDNDQIGRKATEPIVEKLRTAGLSVSVASFPTGVKDANELLVAQNGDAGEVFKQLLAEASPASSEPRQFAASGVLRKDGELVFAREDVSFRAKVYPPQLGRLRATVKVETEERFHIDTLDLYSSRSRTEFGRRVAKALVLEEEDIEAALLALLVEAEKMAAENESDTKASAPPPMTGSERAEALAFLERADLLDQLARDIDALGYVGEEMNKRLLYLVAISRKLSDPLSAVILSQSGAGKSGLTEAIERLTPPEDFVFLTRLTPQSLYYVEDDFLDQKLVIIEERYGSMEADYSIRVLQSRKKLIAAAPIKDPQTGHMRTKVFSVEARAAFIEATTASSVNHENATRCFELAMDESIEQTRRIHERQRFMRTETGLEQARKADAIVKRHWNAQRLLEPIPVVIPFADKLTFPATWMRTRRDHARFLNLIEVSAFLHQYQREKRKCVIQASVEDYRVAYELAAQVLTDTFSDLKKPLREAYSRIQDLCEQGDEGTVSRREIRHALGLPDSTVRGWLSELVALEYLVPVDGGGRGRAVQYRLHERAPRRELVLGLVSPEALHEMTTEIAGSRKNENRAREV